MRHYLHVLLETIPKTYIDICISCLVLLKVYILPVAIFVHLPARPSMKQQNLSHMTQ